MPDFVNLLQKEADAMLPNVSVTENGAVGLKTTGKALLDANFLLSSMRNMSPDEIWQRFLPAYNENPVLAVLWLFFARDCRQGCGERRAFRVIFERLCGENPDWAVKLLPLIPFYGRWDDVVEVVFSHAPCEVRDKAVALVVRQLQSDILSLNAGEPASLLAKWMPSPCTSSDESRRRAEFMRIALGWTPKQYRKNIVALRKHIHVVEQQMSAKQWQDIDYESVPSRAALNYSNAFFRHDNDRYSEYLNNVKEGRAVIHAGVLYPYDIVHAYSKYMNVYTPLEEQWKSLPDTVPPNGSTLVVVDGSGSMFDTVGDSGVTCHDVARSLAIYFADKLRGPYHNSFITFSRNPKVISFPDGLTLKAKLDILRNYAECANTDIKKTFDVILETAVKNQLAPANLPANVLIISD